MSSIAPELKSKLQRDPGAVVNLIVRLKDAPAAHVDDVKARGITVQRTYSLISAMAVQGTASATLALADEPWVLSIEEDKTVHTM
jgi:hypothetical protein